MDEKELYSALGFIKVSRYRSQTLKALGNAIMMPSEIARATGFKTSQVSTALTDLKARGLVVCLNEEARKGRLYRCCDSGLEIIKHL